MRRMEAIQAPLLFAGNFSETVGVARNLSPVSLRSASL